MNETGFPYHPAELSAFAVTQGIFVISLKSGSIIQYTPDDEGLFYNWLVELSVREVVTA